MERTCHLTGVEVNWLTECGDDVLQILSHFLCPLGGKMSLVYSSQRLFCTSGDDTYVYQILFIYVNVKDEGFSLGGTICHAHSRDPQNLNVFTSCDARAKFHKFWAWLTSQKHNIMRDIIIIILPIPIGPSQPMLSVFRP